MRERVIDVDGRLQLLDAMDRNAIGLREAGQRIELLLVGESGIDGGLKLRSVCAAALGRANLIENRRHEPAAHLARSAQLVDFRRERAPHGRERRHAHDRGDDETGQESGESQNDEPADRVEYAHCARSVTSCPPCTTPITTVFEGTSPRPSKAILPVTPSNAGRSAPIRTSRSRIARRSVPTAPMTCAKR